MEREQIIDIINRKIDYSDMEKAKKILSRNYDIEIHKADAEDIKITLSKGNPVAIRNHLIIGYDNLKKAFEDSDGDFFQIERPVEAVAIKEEIDNREPFAIIGRNEWDQTLHDFLNIIEPLKIGEVFLPGHSAIFNFLNPDEETKKKKIQSVLSGVQINVYEPLNYVDNCLHEMGHLFWRTCMKFDEKMQFKELHKYLKPSAIYEYEWERSDEQEVFCTIYKWYLKSILINKSFYNILEFEEPQGLKLLQQVMERKAKDQVINDIWEMSKHEVMEYFNPKFDKTSGKYIRKQGLAEKIKDIELPGYILNQIESVQEGVPYIALGKAIVPVCGNMIDFEKAKYLSKKPDGKGGWIYTYPKDTKGREKKIEEKKEGGKVSQVDTPEFKKWFGDSKVVDSNGKPLVVYHGTKSDFNEFDLNKTGSNNDSGMWGKGFYFSPLKSFSKHYGGNIKKVYLNIQNPFIVTQGMQSLRKIVSKDLSEKLSSPTWDNPEEISKEIRKELLSLGYDGVFQYENGNPDKFTQIVAFYPNQIKSATGNKGTFDANSNDMTKALPVEGKGRYMTYDDVKSFENNPTIFLDMDGVITWFSEAYKTAFDRDVFKDDSFTVTQMCLTQPHFFRTIPVLERGKELYNRLAKKYNVIFLTTPMEGMDYCKSDKLAWLKENICENPTVIFSDNKADYAHSAHDILVDDMTHNLESFAEAGGTAIDFTKHTNDEIMDKIADTLNPQKEIKIIKEQIKNMQVNTSPTEKQKESGIYQKGRFVIKGIPVVIENPKGSVRWGIGENGRKWFNRMKSHYGYIQHKGEAIDGDKVDVFIGDKFSNNKVFVINQGKNNMFDEHKVMIGYPDINTAKESYLACYEKGWEKNIMSIIPTNTKKLKDWLKSGNMNEPYRD